MRTVLFTIDGKLPGLNEIIAASNRHVMEGAKFKKRWTKYCQAFVIKHQVPTFTKPVRVHFTWVEGNHRRDIDNICAGAKFILDALVAHGCFMNDNQKWVTHIEHAFLTNPEYPHVDVKIDEE